MGPELVEGHGNPACIQKLPQTALERASITHFDLEEQKANWDSVSPPATHDDLGPIIRVRAQAQNGKVTSSNQPRVSRLTIWLLTDGRLVGAARRGRKK